MFAIIETGGKQYKVSEGSICKIEKLSADVGQETVFENVLAIEDGADLAVGNPYMEGARVLGKVLSHGKRRKIVVFKYKAKNNYRKKQGHRQPYTEVMIQKIETGRA
ncbi:MAG: 50S ribosomal protein L21 [Dethiobacteria bacterium]|jgi:large subunit ribosomal protein L21